MKQPGRAGRYLRQPQSYSAFVPASSLPPDPRVIMDDEMLALISQGDRALGRLDGSVQTLPDPDLFVFMCVRKEAVLSSQIEGTQSSLNDVLEAEAKVFSASRPRDVDEVIISVQDVLKLTKVSFTAANYLTRCFVKHGVLTEINGQARNRQFRYSQYIDLFADR